jgi:hypothetical protein
MDRLQARKLTEAELDFVSGGIEVTKLTVVTSSTPPAPPSGPTPLPYPNNSVS